MQAKVVGNKAQEAWLGLSFRLRWCYSSGFVWNVVIKLNKLAAKLCNSIFNLYLPTLF